MVAMKKDGIVSGILIIGAGLLWGSMGIFVRFFADAGLGSMEVVALRVILTAAILALVFLAYDRSLFKIKLRDIWCFLGTGLVSIVGFSFCYFYTIEIASLSTAAILLYAAPAIVVLLSAAFFKEKLTWVKAGACVLAFLGCAFAGGITEGISLPVIGLLTGMGSAVGYALYSIFSRFALNRGYRPLTITLYTFIFAIIGVALTADLSKVWTVATASTQNILMSFGMAIVTTVAPYILYTIGLSKTQPGRASIMASVEPVAATVIGAIAFGEAINLSSGIGILLVLASILLLNLRFDRKRG